MDTTTHAGAVRTRRTSRLIATAILLAVVALLIPTTTAPALAAQTPVTDRETSEPTGWLWYQDVSPEFVTDRIDEFGARVTDVEVVSTAPLRLDVQLVIGGGDYHVDAWWWYADLTFDDIGPLLEDNTARLVDIDRYTTPEGHRYAVVMVDNTGDDARAWWWLSGVTTDAIGDLADRNGARIIDLDRGPDGSYDAILVHNSGTDASGWWWLLNVSTDDLAAFADEHEARIIDLEDRGGDRHDAVLVPNGGKVDTWWWYVDVTMGTLVELVTQNGARVIDLERAGDGRFHAVMVDNLTDRDRGTWAAANANLAGGRFGWHLEHVGVGTSSAFRNTTITDPASALKGLHHLHAHRQVMLGNDALGNDVTFYNYTTTQPNPKDACPDPTEEVPANEMTTTLDDALWRMMQNSDNRTTRAMVLRYGGFTTLNVTGALAGMTDTTLAQDIGCGFRDGIRNETTMRDLSSLYASVVDGSRLSGTARDEFYADMNGGPGTLGGLNDVVTQEASALGLTAAQEAEFMANAIIRAKGGSYDICTGAGCEYIRANAGVVTLPHKLGASTYELQQYSYGVFTDRLQLPCLSCAETASANTSFDAMRDELFRAEIRTALATFLNGIDPDDLFGTLTAVQAALGDIELPDRADRRKLEEGLAKASDRLGRALEEDHWATSTELTDAGGKKALDELAKAVHELEKIQDDLPEVTSSLERALAVARQLAAAQIEQAEAMEGDGQELEQASEALLRGDELADGGDAHRAAKEYRKAWHAATKSVDTT